MSNTLRKTLSNDPRLIERYQRLNDMLLAFHVVVDRRFHRLANENPDGAIQFVDEIRAGLKAIYRHPEFRTEAWKAKATKREKAEAAEAWMQAFGVLWRGTPKVSNLIAATADRAETAEAETAAGLTAQNPEIDCSPLCEENGVCMPCNP